MDSVIWTIQQTQYFYVRNFNLKKTCTNRNSFEWSNHFLKTLRKIKCNNNDMNHICSSFICPRDKSDS